MKKEYLLALYNKKRNELIGSGEIYPQESVSLLDLFIADLEDVEVNIAELAQQISAKADDNEPHMVTRRTSTQDMIEKIADVHNEIMEMSIIREYANTIVNSAQIRMDKLRHNKEHISKLLVDTLIGEEYNARRDTKTQTTDESTEERVDESPQ